MQFTLVYTGRWISPTDQLPPNGWTLHRLLNLTSAQRFAKYHNVHIIMYSDIVMANALIAEEDTEGGCQRLPQKWLLRPRLHAHKESR